MHCRPVQWHVCVGQRGLRHCYTAACYCRPGSQLLCSKGPQEWRAPHQYKCVPWKGAAGGNRLLGVVRSTWLPANKEHRNAFRVVLVSGAGEGRRLALAAPLSDSMSSALELHLQLLRGMMGCVHGGSTQCVASMAVAGQLLWHDLPGLAVWVKEMTAGCLPRGLSSGHMLMWASADMHVGAARGWEQDSVVCMA
jgi:hypothetical protein